MAFVRHYILETSADKAGALQNTLLELRDVVTGCAGCVRVDMLHAVDRPEHMFFIEHWTDKAHHEAAGRHMPPTVMATLKQLLVAPPAMADLVDADHAP